MPVPRAGDEAQNAKGMSNAKLPHGTEAGGLAFDILAPDKLPDAAGIGLDPEQKQNAAQIEMAPVCDRCETTQTVICLLFLL